MSRIQLKTKPNQTKPNQGHLSELLGQVEDTEVGQGPGTGGGGHRGQVTDLGRETGVMGAVVERSVLNGYKEVETNFGNITNNDNFGSCG